MAVRRNDTQQPMRFVEFVERNASDSDRPDLLCNRGKALVHRHDPQFPAIIARRGHFPVLAQRQRGNKPMFCRGKKGRKKSRIRVKTPNIAPIARYQNLLAILGDAESANALGFAGSHRFSIEFRVFLRHRRNHETPHGRLGSARDRGNVPDLHRTVVPAGNRDSAPRIKRRAPHMFPLVSLQNRHADAFFIPQPNRAVFRRGKEKRGNEEAVPETRAMAVETEKRGIGTLEEGVDGGGFDRIPWLRGGRVPPDDQRAIVRDGEKVATVLAPAQFEDHSRVLATDEGVLRCGETPDVDFGEDGAGSDEEVAVQRENGHAVQDAAVVTVIEVIGCVRVWIPLDDGVVGCAYQERGETIGRTVHKCNVPNPIDKTGHFVFRFAGGEFIGLEGVPIEQYELFVSKNAQFGFIWTLPHHQIQTKANSVNQGIMQRSNSTHLLEGFVFADMNKCSRT